MIAFNKVSFSYDQQTIIDQITFSIEAGEHVTIVGANGSGKSTLARLMNGLLLPTSGTVQIGELFTHHEKTLGAIRQKVGMVFQNPENQMVATTVLEDVAFGLENISFPREKMMERIQEVLERVNMWEERFSEPHLLSGGQKQRVAIAGALATKPEILVLDEATSMLDPEGRRQMNQLIQELNHQGITIISITHDMEEAFASSRMIILDQGKIVSDQSPRATFQQHLQIDQSKLKKPFALEMKDLLMRQGVQIPHAIQNQEELVEYLWKLSSTK